MASELPNFGMPQSNLGSLTQAARQKQLNQARGVLLAVGILIVIGNALVFTQVERLVEDAIQKEIQAAQPQGMFVVDQAELARARESLIRINQMITGGWVVLGILFIVFATLVKKHPAPITILSLVLFLGAQAITGFIDKTTLLQGWLIKIIVIVVLIKSIQAAIAYQREVDREAARGGFPS